MAQISKRLTIAEFKTWFMTSDGTAYKAPQDIVIYGAQEGNEGVLPSTVDFTNKALPPAWAEYVVVVFKRNSEAAADIVDDNTSVTFTALDSGYNGSEGLFTHDEWWYAEGEYITYNSVTMQFVWVDETGRQDPDFKLKLLGTFSTLFNDQYHGGLGVSESSFLWGFNGDMGNTWGELPIDDQTNYQRFAFPKTIMLFGYRGLPATPKTVLSALFPEITLGKIHTFTDDPNDFVSLFRLKSKTGYEDQFKFTPALTYEDYDSLWIAVVDDIQYGEDFVSSAAMTARAKTVYSENIEPLLAQHDAVRIFGDVATDSTAQTFSVTKCSTFIRDSRSGGLGQAPLLSMDISSPTDTDAAFYGFFVPTSSAQDFITAITPFCHQTATFEITSSLEDVMTDTVMGYAFLKGRYYYSSSLGKLHDFVPENMPDSAGTFVIARVKGRQYDLIQNSSLLQTKLNKVRILGYQVYQKNYATTNTLTVGLLSRNPDTGLLASDPYATVSFDIQDLPQYESVFVVVTSSLSNDVYANADSYGITFTQIHGDSTKQFKNVAGLKVNSSTSTEFVQDIQLPYPTTSIYVCVIKKVNISTVTNLENRLTTVQSDLAEVQSENATLESQNTQLQSDLAEAQSENATLESQNTQLQSDLAEAQSQANNWNGVITAIQANTAAIAGNFMDVLAKNAQPGQLLVKVDTGYAWKSPNELVE